MQGFFRVDGADLETGEETYLVIQAADSNNAEEVARKQGLLIASVRSASSEDWGVAPSTPTTTIENASLIEFETAVQPDDRASDPITAPVLDSSEFSANAPSDALSAQEFFLESSPPDSPVFGLSDPQPDPISADSSIAPPRPVLPESVPEVAEATHATKPDSPSPEPEVFENPVLVEPEPVAPQSGPVTTGSSTTESDAARDLLGLVVPELVPNEPTVSTLENLHGNDVAAAMSDHHQAAGTPLLLNTFSPSDEQTSVVETAQSGGDRDADVSPQSEIESPARKIDPLPQYAIEPAAQAIEETHMATHETESVAPLESPLVAATVLTAQPRVFADTPLSSEEPSWMNPEPTQSVIPDKAEGSAAGKADSVVPIPVDLVKEPPVVIAASVASETVTCDPIRAESPSPITPGPSVAASEVMPEAKQAAVEALTPVKPGEGPTVRRPAGGSVPAKRPAAAQKPSVSAIPKPVAKPMQARPSVPVRDTSTPQTAGRKMVTPPRPIPSLVGPRRPTRLTPPEVKRVPPIAPVPVSGVTAEVPSLPVSKTPALEVPKPPAIQSLAPREEIDAPTGGIREPAAGVVVPPPLAASLEVVAAAPVEHEPERVSGEVMGGSGIEQVATPIAREQADQTVEHSADSTPEALTSSDDRSYPSEIVSIVAVVPVVENAEWTSAGPALAESKDPVSDAFSDVTVEAVTPALVTRANLQSVPRDSGPTLSPLLFILCPLALLLTGVGVGVMLYSLLSVPSADLSDFDKMDFRLLNLGKAFLGGMVFLAGLILFLAAGLTHVASKLRSRHA